jgi:hypothetical protein
MRIISRLLIVLTIISLPSCTHPASPDSRDDSDVVILSTKANYVVGETVSAHLFNRSDEQITFGACAVSLERYEGGRWTHVWPTSGACIAILLSLSPNNNRTLEVPLETGIGPGTYRLRMSVSNGDNRAVRSIYSPTFVVRAAA